MREIKFRGKLKEHFGDKNGNVVLQKGTWIYGGIVFDENRVWIDTKYYGEIIVDKDTIGQYTGLHDKNGKEIYEGDIVRVENTDLAQIIYDEDRMAWGIKPINDFYFDSPLLADNTDLELKVFGNIYDNPELLKEV